jgi:hypothetical protein
MSEKYKIPEPTKKPIRCPLCLAEFARNFLPSRNAEAFFCHFCKVAIMCNDPFVDRWDETYAKGEKLQCPACGTTMRFFCTSTGYMLAQCPVKRCQSRMELSAPDRGKQEAPRLFDASGDPIKLPSVNKAIATPEAPAVTQVMGDGRDPDLPAEVDFRLPSKA